MTADQSTTPKPGGPGPKPGGPSHPTPTAPPKARIGRAA